jgi:hypothetical protein
VVVVVVDEPVSIDPKEAKAAMEDVVVAVETEEVVIEVKFHIH